MVRAFCIGLIWLLAVPSCNSSTSKSSANASCDASALNASSTFEGNELLSGVKTIFQSHCVECHGSSLTRGGVRLDQAADAAAFAAAAGRAMQTGSMPPAEKPRPSASEIDQVANWVSVGAPRDLDELTARCGSGVATALNGLRARSGDEVHNQLLKRFDLTVSEIDTTDPSLTVNPLTEGSLSAPLGIPDGFRTVRERNNSLAKVDVQRSLAMETASVLIAKQLVDREFSLGKSQRKLFINVDASDLADELVTEQIKTLFQKLVYRKATSEERTDLKSLFTTSQKNEGSALTAWKVVVYAIVSSVEFWSL